MVAQRAVKFPVMGTSVQRYCPSSRYNRTPTVMSPRSGFSRWAAEPVGNAGKPINAKINNAVTVLEIAGGLGWLIWEGAG